MSDEQNNPFGADYVRVYRDFIRENLRNRHDVTLEQRRAGMEALAERTPLRDDVRVSNTEIEGVPTWVLTPDSVQHEDHGAILYAHGGAFLVGSFYSHGWVATEIAAAADATVYFPEYRLAPECPFPAALDDITAVYRALVQQRKGRSGVGVCGDSAGASLVLSLLHVLQENGGETPSACVAIAPAVDLTFSSEYCKKAEGTKDFFLTRNTTLEDISIYLNGHDPRDPLVSPLFAELGNPPPMLLQVAGDELILGDVRDYADKLMDAPGTTVRLEVYAHMQHCWHLFSFLVPEARIAVNSIGRFFKDYL